MSEGFMLTVCEIYILTPKEKKKKENLVILEHLTMMMNM